LGLYCTRVGRLARAVSRKGEWPAAGERVRVWRLPVLFAFFVLAGCGSATQAGAPPGDGVVRTAGCGPPTTAPAMTVGGTLQPANQNALDEIANRVQPYGMEHFAGVYTSVEIRSESNRIRVYRVPSAVFDAWILKEFAAVCVEVADARHSRQELTALGQRIADDIDYWNAQGIPINSISPAHDGSGVQVTTTNIAKASEELPARYGTDAPITITYGEPAVGI
jgi:hypothetical protein